jgi:hypothetical protein
MRQADGERLATAKQVYDILNAINRLMTKVLIRH